MEGWIKLHRKMVEWEWYSDTNTFRIFFHLILTANHKDVNYKGLLIKRGQRLISYNNIINEIGDKNLTINKVRTAMEHLKKTRRNHRGNHREDHRVWNACNHCQL